MPAGANGLAGPVSIRTSIAGQGVELLPDRALFWPAASTLIVADLHWGKPETFHAAGIPIPDGILDHDLARLSRMLEATGASRLLVLGDLIHSGVGLTPRLVDAVEAWRLRFSVRLELIPGNHDRHADRLPDAWGITLRDAEVREGPFVFRHDPAGNIQPFTFSGHIHPMVRLADLRLPCFLLGPALGVLPAFGLFTRGMTIHPEQGDRVFAVADGQVVELPIRDSQRARMVR